MWCFFANKNIEMILVQKIMRLEQVQILIMFDYDKTIVEKIKSINGAKYTNTMKGWLLPYCKTSWAEFLNLGLEYKIDNSGTAGCAEPLSAHTGEKIADVPQSFTEKAADTTNISIKYFHPYFFIKGDLTEKIIADIKSNPKSYWNARYANWTLIANAVSIDMFFRNWKIIDENQSAIWKKQIATIIDPATCSLYTIQRKY